ncbi:hypothetical protein PR202_ga20820 [Eleusine coracana subsp. coracana]|uniref:Uncharacterized protein n=1 Tax=Eleusine coracana subsp. coracana TaxID=191504 RepID=A0AAV5CZS0_ELECO|nr:hypothetical protein PR202_ga20820 [Eleusine coracana subsp. coracana]
MAAAPAVRFPVYGIVRMLGVAAVAAIIFWAIYFRGGMTLSSSVEDKLLLFNVIPHSLSVVHPVLMVIGLVALNGEGLCPPCEES